MMSTLIATSISPDNIENQRNAVTSWLKLGFHVVSVNSQEEINVLQKDFRDIRFERVTRTGAAITGKPLIFLDDILTMLSRDGGDIVGIINSDIILDAPSNFQKMTIAHAKNGLIFGPRIEVNSVTSREGTPFFSGFDFFFFDKVNIKALGDTDLCLGAPWWDYWIPLRNITSGIPVKLLLDPVAFHLIHEIRWNKQLMRHYALKFTNYMLSDQVYVDDYLRVIFEFTNTTQEFSYIAPLVNKYILINSEHFSLGLELEVSKLDTSRHYEIIDIKVTKNLLKDIMTIKKSLTWKITHPFRNIPDYFKKMIIAVKNKTEI